MLIRTTAAFAAAAILCGCAGVTSTVQGIGGNYSPLPEAAMREAAVEIEAVVASGNRHAELVGTDGVVLDSDPVRQAIRSRAARSALISEFRDTGHIIEQANGLVAIQRSREYKNATTRRERDRHAVLIMGENNDRWALYEGLLKAGKFSPASLGKVQRMFAEARIPHLKPGQTYEDEHGNTMVKQ